MGSACCVAARDKTLANRSNFEASHRNARYSPSWSFRWDNGGRVAGEVEHLPNHFSNGISRNSGFEIKGGMNVETEDVSYGGSPLGNFQTPTWQKSPSHGGATGTPASDQSVGSNFSIKVKGTTESSPIDPSERKLSFSIPSTSSLAIDKADSISSQQTRHSPGYQLSDGQISELKSPNNSVSDGRPSFVLSMCSNDLTIGSQGGSSDGWSLRTFSELVASSQNETRSLDSESLSSSHGKITRSNSHLSTRHSIDLQICGVCSKLLIERSLWSTQKIIPNNELPMVSVLVCGHVFHADCLENITTEVERYDPSCPLCTFGDNKVMKMLRKGLKEADLKARNNKISKNRVMDSGLDAIMFNAQKSNGREEKGPKMGTSSSLRSSFGRPFLRRHFSLGSKSTKSLLENDTVKRKGFWARYR